MGKGGYSGGSTIIYLKPSREDEESNRALANNKTYLCERCNKRFIGDSYFHHLLEHGLSGCTSCGKPYKDQGDRVHCCEKCGKSTILRLRNKEERKQAKTKKANKVTRKVIKRSYKDKTIRHSRPRKGKAQSSKFGVSLGDLLQEAMIKKGRN